MDSQFLKNDSSSDDDATHPENNGEIPQMALDGLWEGFTEISNDGQYCYQLFTVALPPWTDSTEQAPAPEPTAQPATGNADNSDDSAPNHTDIQPPHSDYATGPVAETAFTSQTDAPINEEPRAVPTLMPSMVQNGSSPSSDSYPPELTRLQRRSRERQARALRRSVAHARAHAIAPSPSTSSATSPQSEKGEYMKMKKAFLVGITKKYKKPRERRPAATPSPAPSPASSWEMSSAATSPAYSWAASPAWTEAASPASSWEMSSAPSSPVFSWAESPAPTETVADEEDEDEDLFNEFIDWSGGQV